MQYFGGTHLIVKSFSEKRGKVSPQVPKELGHSMYISAFVALYFKSTGFFFKSLSLQETETRPYSCTYPPGPIPRVS